MPLPPCLRFLAATLWGGALLLCSVAAVAQQQGRWREHPLEGLRERLQARQAPAPAAPAEPAGAQRLGPGDHTGTLLHGGLQRHYRVHVPARYDPSRPEPLLIALHGGGGNMDLEADDARYGLVSLSEREGAIVVFPNGSNRHGGERLATWNAGRCCGPARDQNVDDVGYIRALVQRLAAQLAFDRQRVWATGMSNGGMMAYRLACELPDVVSAIAAVAGTDNAMQCTPGRAVSVLHIHARDDDHVLFNGGHGPASAFPASVADYTSVPATVAKWTAIDRCPASPQRVLDVPGARCERYAPCGGGSAVQLCVTEQGGHSWPRGQRGRGGAPTQALSADDVMWRFFQAQAQARGQGGR